MAARSDAGAWTPPVALINSRTTINQVAARAKGFFERGGWGVAHESVHQIEN